MPVFRFEAIDPTGQEVRDTVDAPSEQTAIAGLKQRGLFVTAISEISAGVTPGGRVMPPGSGPAPLRREQPRAGVPVAAILGGIAVVAVALAASMGGGLSFLRPKPPVEHQAEQPSRAPQQQDPVKSPDESQTEKPSGGYGLKPEEEKSPPIQGESHQPEG